MNAHIASWLDHPVTLLLAAALLGLFLLVVEVLLRSLAEMGNVRFQGMLEDHQKLLPVKGETLLHVSRLTDVLRWLEIACAGLLWVVLFRLAGDDRLVGVALAVLVPAGLIAIRGWSSVRSRGHGGHPAPRGAAGGVAGGGAGRPLRPGAPGATSGGR
jgi:hypothetical protein